MTIRQANSNIINAMRRSALGSYSLFAAPYQKLPRFPHRALCCPFLLALIGSLLRLFLFLTQISMLSYSDPPCFSLSLLNLIMHAKYPFPLPIQSSISLFQQQKQITKITKSPKQGIKAPRHPSHYTRKPVTHIFLFFLPDRLETHLDAAELALELVGDIIVRRRRGARVSPHIKGLVQGDAAT